MSAHPQPNYLVARIARALAPRTERRWIDAMLAELDAVDAERRGSWMAGALFVTWSATGMRLRALPPAICCGIVLATCGVILFSIGAATEAEGLVAEDDLFLPLAWICGVVLAAFGVLAINWVFNRTDTVSRTR